MMLQTNAARCLLGACTIAMSIALAGCAGPGDRRYHAQPGDAVVSVVGRGEITDMCVGDRYYSLIATKSGGITTFQVPIGQRVGLWTSLEARDFTGSYKYCHPKISFIPVANGNYILAAQTRDDQCYFELARGDEKRLVMEPSIGPVQSCTAYSSK